MAREEREWADVTDDELLEWGNTWKVVEFTDGGEARVLFAGWQENPTGSMSLRRLVGFNPEIPMVVEFDWYGPGRVRRIRNEAFTFDFEAIKDQQEAQRQAQAAAALAPPGMPLLRPIVPGR